MSSKIFNLENQYRLYLKRMSLNENTMEAQQKAETKRAFYGACGQMLMLLANELAALPEDEAIKELESMTKQVSQLFINQTERQN
jgi:hypothetical protein